MNLFVENDGWAQMLINEHSSSPNKLEFTGLFQHANIVNKNKRMYPFEVLDANVKRLTESMKNRSLYGELDHPECSIISLKNSAFLVTELFWKNGNELWGKGEVLSTPAGTILKKLLESNCRVGVSSRGVGTAQVNSEGVSIIENSYKMISFDTVADPSCHSAFQKVVKSEGNNYYDTPTIKETRRFNKDAFISLVGCLMEQKSGLKNKI